MNVEEKIISIIKSNLETPIAITRESRLIEDLNVDSFSMIMIVNECEDEFSIAIDDNDLMEMRTVSDIIVTLKEKYLKV
ncbi:MAG: acyl carrier protein [bacterium]